MDELNGRLYLNLIKKIEFELNFILIEPELEPQPCDLCSMYNQSRLNAWDHVWSLDS